MADLLLDDLNPTLRVLALEWLEQCLAKGLDVKITETWRDPAREDKLHAQGITKATGATCEHCAVDWTGKPASRAFDFAVFRNHIYITDGKDVAYELAGEIGKSLGLCWGGNFTNPDWDHLELPAQVGATILPFPQKT